MFMRIFLLIGALFMTTTDWRAVYGQSASSADAVLLAAVEEIDPSNGAVSVHHWATESVDVKGRSVNSRVSFDGETRLVTGVDFDTSQYGRGQSVTFGKTASNDGTYTIETVVDAESFTVYESVTTEPLGAVADVVFGGFSYLPYLELGRGMSASLAAGDNLDGRGEFDEATYRVVNPSTDGYPLDDLFGKEFSGRRILVEALIRDASRGLYASFSERVVVTDGRVGEEPVWDTTGLELPVIPVSGQMQSSFGEVYTGQGLALLFTGNAVSPTRVVVPGSAWNPSGSFTFQHYAYVGSRLGDSLGDEHVWDKGLHRLVIEHDTADALRPWRAKFTVTVGGVEYTATSPAISREGWHWVTARYDASTGVLEVWADGDDAGSATAASASAPDTDSTALVFGMNSAQTAGAFRGIAASFRIWDSALSDDDAGKYQRAPLVGTEADLAAVWRGDTNLGVTTLFDYGPSRDETTNSSPLDGAVSNGAIAHTLEGGDSLAGTAKPFGLGYVDNAPGSLVAPQFLVYQFSYRGVSEFVEVFDKGGALTVTTVYTDLVEFFLNPPAVTGDVTVYPFLGLVRLKERSNDGQVTASLWGSSPYFAGADFDGVNDYADFGTGVNAALSGTYTLMGWLHILDAEPSTARVVMSNKDTGGGLSLIYFFDGGQAYELVVQVGHAGGTVGATIDLSGLVIQGPSGEALLPPVHLAVQPVSNTRLDVYLNGQLDHSAAQTVTFTAASSSNFVVGANRFGNNAFSELRVSQLALFTSALSQADVRKWMNQGIPLDGQPATLRHYWPFDSELGTTWRDRGTGSAVDGTLTNGAGWSAGVAAPSILRQWWLLMSTDAGIGDEALDTERAFEISADAVSLFTRNERDVLSVVEEVMQGANAFTVFDRNAGSWRLVRLLDPSTLTASRTIHEWELAGPPRALNVERPPSEFLVGYHPVGLTQTEDQVIPEAGGGPSESRRALLGEPLRYEVASVPSNAVTYPLSQARSVIEGRWAHQRGAIREGELQAAVRGVPRRFWEVELLHGLREDVPGDVVSFEHSRIPGGARNYFVVGLDDDVERAVLRLYG